MRAVRLRARGGQKDGAVYGLSITLPSPEAGESENLRILNVNKLGAVPTA